MVELRSGSVLTSVAPPSLLSDRRGGLRRRLVGGGGGGGGRRGVDNRAVVGWSPPAAGHRGPRVVDEAGVEARHHRAAHHCHEH